MDDDESPSDSACPFCGINGDCAHLLLVVDRTFRAAAGGILMDAFNARWSACFRGADFNERQAFGELLEEVDALSDAMAEHDHEGGPGMSSSYSTYFAQSVARARGVLERFSSGED